MHTTGKRKYILISVALLVCILGTALWYHDSRVDTTGPNATHLTLYTNNDGPESSIVLSGKIGDYGHTIRNDENGKTILDLSLTHGSLRLDATSLEKAFSIATEKASYNQTTCSSTTTVQGAASIVRNSGTGAYKGASGTFTLKMTLDEVVPKSANCNGNDRMLGQAIVATGWGDVSL